MATESISTCTERSVCLLVDEKRRRASKTGRNRGGSTGGAREAIASPPPVDSCWPKNRDAELIKRRFYQSQNAPKLAFLSSKIERRFLGRGHSPLPRPSFGGNETLFHIPNPLGAFDASILAPTALDLEAYGASALGASIRPPSHSFWIRPWREWG